MSDKETLITILMADDDEEDRMLLEEAWEENRIANPLRFVEDGEQLLDYLLNRGGYQDVNAYPKPGLILLDLNMPKKDGREALAEIKSHPQLKHIPVVILTTSKAEEDVLRSYHLGVNSYITKPVSFDDLVELVRTLTAYWFGIVRLSANAMGERWPR